MKMKKLFSRLILAVFTVSMFVVPGANAAGGSFIDFLDVEYDHPNIEAIYYLQAGEVVDGYDDGTYKPEISINRAEFLKIVMGASDYEASGENCFSDVTDEWFAPYVCAASELELVEGYPDGTFKPSKEINFAEASKIVVNILGLEVDDSKDDAWFHGFVDSLEGISAIPATVLSFDKTLTRAEMSDMVWRISTENTYELSNTYEGLQKGEEVVGNLKTFTTCDQLRAYMDSNTVDYNYYYNAWGVETDDVGETEESLEMPAAEKSAAEGAEGGGGGEGGVEYSTTNIQVEGVDEADVVKNDDGYVYLLKGDTLRIVKAYPPGELEEVTVYEFASSDFYPSEMYVDGDQLVVIGSLYDYLNYFVEGDAGDYYGEMTEVYILDISDRANVKVDRQLAFEGYYSSSRKVDDMLYVVTNKYTSYWWDWPEMTDEEVVPLYADSTEDEVLVACECSDVLYVPGVDSTDYMVVAGVPLDDMSADVATEVVVGYSGDIYASRENLYVAEPYYSPISWDDYWGTWDEETIVHKFNLGRDDMAYTGSGVVPGRTLNQFSMDENDGYFRIATTKGSTWDEDNPSTNNLFVLDDELDVVGSVEGLAPGEEIYSTRFIGDRAYMVTFKTIDPLFVIDVSDPTDPEVLGELKIPGFSDYLHPFGQDYLIGFGLDTDAFTEEEAENWGGDFAWFQGVKLAMFDVSDVENPVELHKVTIGDRGTYSELSWNHKALLFDKGKGLMAFPITVAEISQEIKDNPDSPSWTYGDYTYQGAYVYDVSVSDGFELRGKITHYDDFDTEYNKGWDYTKWIDRILYIGDYFYTTSEAFVKASDMDDLEDVGDVELAD